MLKPVQASSRAQLSEQSSSEDDDIVLFAMSKAHLTGPSFVVLGLLYDVTCADNSRDVTGMTNCSISGSGASNTATNIALVPQPYWYIGTILNQYSTNMEHCAYIGQDITIVF